MPTVLIVDDTASIRMLARTNLELAGYSVTEACDGAGCIAALEKAPQQYDAVAIDVMMPGLDGFETVREIRANSVLSHLPVVLMSTRAREVDINCAQAAGADAYVTKPFDPDRLIAVVNSVLGCAETQLWAPEAIESGRSATRRRRGVDPESAVSETTPCDGSLEQ